MPTYLYRRDDGSTFEIEQRITDPRLTVCPTTGKPVTRLISGGAGLVFKGSGFYATDYASNGKKDSAVSPAAPSSGDSSTKKSTDTAASESKSSDSTKSD